MFVNTTNVFFIQQYQAVFIIASELEREFKESDYNGIKKA